MVVIKRNSLQHITRTPKHLLAKGASCTAIVAAMALSSPCSLLADDTDKPSYPTVTKTVRDETASSDEWTEDADGSLGETLTFRCDGTLPSNLGDLAGYMYRFVDTIPSGIQMVPDSHTVTLVRENGTTVDLTEHFTMTYNPDKGTVTIACGDLLGIGATLGPEDHIVATYDFTVTDGAVMGFETGNPSFVHVEWAELDGSGHGTPYKTVDDGANVYTYGLRITKLEKDTAKRLGGASFQVGTTDGKWMSATGWTGDRSHATTLTTGVDGTIELPRIDGGEYLLVETEAPTGYDKADDTPVTIRAGLGKDPKTLTAASTVTGAVDGVDPRTGIVSCSVRDSLTGEGGGGAPGGTTPTGDDTPSGSTPTGDGTPGESTPIGGSPTPGGPGAVTRETVKSIVNLLQTGAGLPAVIPLLAAGVAGLLLARRSRRRRQG